jgi:hypothetical protein
MSGGEKARNDGAGEVPKGWDHDPPAKAKLVPYGILMVATGALMLVFGSHDTSDAWVDALRMWWPRVGPGLGSIKRLVIYLENGPKDSGRRAQFLKRMVEFADWSGWRSAWCTIRLITASITRSSGAGRRWRGSGMGCR